MTSSIPNAPTRPPHAGLAELHALGHELLAMLRYSPEEHRPTTYLVMAENPERHYDTCPICGFDRVPGGDFKLTHEYKRLGVELPYLAPHMLAAHGVARRQDMGVIEELMELLNYPERDLARRLVGIASGAAPEVGVGFEHERVKGSHECHHCGDRLNLGQVFFARGSEKVGVQYIGIHSLYEHQDKRWIDDDGKKCEVDIDALRKLLDAGAHLALLGKQLASILQFLGGTQKPPGGLIVEEHPLRGVESCQRCDGRPNMGSFTLHSRPLGQSMTLPYIAVHTLIEHANAEYLGSLHTGVVDVRQLHRMLNYRAR